MLRGLVAIAGLALLLSAASCGTAGKRGSVGALEGMASWYGERFHGRKTASGERYDMNALTAAHRTLPFGTRVRVRSVRDGRSVIVRINDRGPFASDRIIDVSKRAAELLGMIASGLAEVELELLD